MDSIPAIDDAGVFRTLQPVNLAEGMQAEVISLATGTAAGPPLIWPPNYFDQTTGALEGKDFERSPQGNLRQSCDDKTK